MYVAYLVSALVSLISAILLYIQVYRNSHNISINIIDNNVTEGEVILLLPECTDIINKISDIPNYNTTSENVPMISHVRTANTDVIVEEDTHFSYIQKYFYRYE